MQKRTMYPPVFIKYPKIPLPGDPVFVIGHALFQKEHGLGPMVTSGSISKIVRIGDKPVMIQVSKMANWLTLCVLSQIRL